MKQTLLTCALLLTLLMGCKKQEASVPDAGTDSTAGSNPALREATVAGGVVQAGEWTILATLTDHGDLVRARQNVAETLAKTPGVAGLVGLSSYSGPAILAACADSARAKSIKVICFDEEEETLAGVASGTIAGTVIPQSFEIGYRSIKLLDQLARGDKAGMPADGVIEIPSRVIRQQDVTEIQRTLKEMQEARNTPPARPGSNTYAFVTNNASTSWQAALAGIHKAEQELGVACEFQMPTEGTPAEQTRLVEAMITRQVKGIAISPCDPASQAATLKRANETIRNVITQGNDATSAGLRCCFLKTDEYKAGRETGKLIRETLPHGGKLALFAGNPGVSPARERRQGIIDELSGKP